MFVPTKAFLTKGVGRHKEKLTSFEMALRDAHLANFNLVRVSSIFPPHCELVDREEGLSPEAMDYVALWIEAKYVQDSLKAKPFTIVLCTDMLTYIEGKEVAIELL